MPLSIYFTVFITFSHNMSIWNKLKPYSLYFHWNKYGTIFRNNIFKTQWLSDNIPEEMPKCAIDIFSKTDLNISYVLIVFGKSYFFLYWVHPIGLNPVFHKNYNIFDRRQYNLSTNSQSMQVSILRSVAGTGIQGDPCGHSPSSPKAVGLIKSFLAPSSL